MKGKKTIRVGDQVRFRWGVTNVTGTITEDRGPIGRKGRRLYRIHFSTDQFFEADLELSAEDFEVVNKAASADARS